MNEPDDELLLNAYVDGELDAAGVIGLERRLAAEPELAAARDRLLSLRDAIRTQAPREAAPETLKARLLAHVAQGSSPPAEALSWRGYVGRASLAASLTIAAGLAGFFIAPRANERDARFDALVTGHMRGQISGRPVDIASDDRHMVKPWLASKSPLASVVLDLGKEGFPLVGARLDIVDGAAVPTLVFKRREHLISVAELPSRGETAMASELRKGYPLLSWSDDTHFYVVVSDISPSELQAFAVLFREAAGKDRSTAAPDARQ